MANGTQGNADEHRQSMLMATDYLEDARMASDAELGVKINEVRAGLINKDNPVIGTDRKAVSWMLGEMTREQIRRRDAAENAELGQAQTPGQLAPQVQVPAGDMPAGTFVQSADQLAAADLRQRAGVLQADANSMAEGHPDRAGKLQLAETYLSVANKG